jgi:hypothetical protein
MEDLGLGKMPEVDIVAESQRTEPIANHATNMDLCQASSIISEPNSS